MAWLLLREKVIINTAELVSVEARSSAGMSHAGSRTPEELEALNNLCFKMADGSEHVRYFVPVLHAGSLIENLLSRHLASSRDIIRLDLILAEYGITPEGTY